VFTSDGMMHFGVLIPQGCTEMVHSLYIMLFKPHWTQTQWTKPFLKISYL